MFFALRGPLGAGKSVFARAVARGAGVRGPVPSPTFNLVFQYRLTGGGSVIHADLYRIRDPDELDGIGWDDLLGADGAIALVEWPERAGDRLPGDRWDVALTYGDRPGVRDVVVTRRGEPAELWVPADDGRSRRPPPPPPTPTTP